jgi:protein-tyrosine-phosphatase
MVRSATLVIAATREVRGFIDSVAPGTTARVYTLLELANLLDGLPPSVLGIDGLVDLAASRRTISTLVEESNDLPDPRGEAPEAYRHMIRTVGASLDIIAPALVPVAAPNEAADPS